MLLKCCTQYVSKFVKTQKWPQDWKMPILFPILKKGSTKDCSNRWIIILILHASKIMLKILWAILQHYVNWEFPDIQAAFWKGRGTRDQPPTFTESEKAREFQKNIYLCVIDYPKAFDCVNHNKLWKTLKDMGISGHLTYLLRNLMQSKKKQLEPCMEQLTGSGLRKEYKSVDCYPVCWTYTQSTSCEMLGLVSCKLESRLLGEISKISGMWVIPL